MYVTKRFYVTDGGYPKAGLAPTFKSLKKVSDGTDYSSEPSIIEIGGGWYKYNLTLDPFVDLTAVIDAGAALTDNNDRYIYHEVRHTDTIRQMGQDAVVIPTYDEDTLALTFVVFLLSCGHIVTTGVSNASISVYNTNHTLQFTVSTGSFTNGVGVMVKNDPTLNDNETYYVELTLTTSQGVHESVTTYTALP